MSGSGIGACSWRTASLNPSPDRARSKQQKQTAPHLTKTYNYKQYMHPFRILCLSDLTSQQTGRPSFLTVILTHTHTQLRWHPSPILHLLFQFHGRLSSKPKWKLALTRRCQFCLTAVFAVTTRPVFMKTTEVPSVSQVMGRNRRPITRHEPPHWFHFSKLGNIPSLVLTSA